MVKYFNSPHATIGIFSETSAAQPHIDRMHINVDMDMVVIGGGVVGNDSVGKLLTASYPNSDLSSWIVGAKDHIHSDLSPITGYAIGLRIYYPNGLAMNRMDMMPFLHLTSETSPVMPHPHAFAKMWPICHLVGGGFQVNWSGAGNLATASFPTVSQGLGGWQVKSKDHVLESQASITAYAIGLETAIVFTDEVSYTVDRTWGYKPSAPAPHPASSVTLDPGFLVTGGGANVQWEHTFGAGNLLWKLEPFGDEQTQEQGFRVASKDHDVSNPCEIDAYAIGIRFI
jgi:hypothetical protein